MSRDSFESAFNPPSKNIEQASQELGAVLLLFDGQRDYNHRTISTHILLDSTIMAEDIRVAADGTYVLVVSSGPPSLEEMKRTLSKLAELRRDHWISSVLVDSRARRGQPSIVEIYAGGKLLSETLAPGIRIAVLVSEVTSHHTFF